MRLHFYIISLMLAQAAVSTPCEELLEAAAYNRVVGLVELINKCKRSGETPPWTAMHEAALKNARLVVRVLANNGVSVNARDGNYFTPLFVAQAKGHDSMAALLVSLGGHL